MDMSRIGPDGTALETTISAQPNGAEALLARIEELEQRLASLEDAPAQSIEDRLSMVVFSGDMDKAIASFIIATGAAAMGMQVSLFFTFWGLNVVKKQKVFRDKNSVQKAFSAVMPAGPDQLNLSQMNLFGAGARVMRKIMADNDVMSLNEFVELAQEFGVRMVACDMSQELLGIHDEELIDGMEHGGVATFLGDAAASKVTLFI
jgi:peroxiredoxin family protein